MEARLAVLAATEAFGEVWAELAEAAELALQLAADPASLGPVSAVALLVGVGGSESRAAELLGAVGSAGWTGEVAVVGAVADHRVAVSALGAGAGEYFALPGDLEALRGWVEERGRWKRSRDRARELAEAERREFDFSRIVGSSPELKAALDRAARVIPRSTTTVLLTGETGTGKELVAQAIHYSGPRASHPFVEVNCTALPPNLLEAELFGHEKGAFTDAHAAKPGLFEAAHLGTLFLDEIGDLPLELQGKLLKVLEDKRVRRLGSVQSMDVDVRIIAATHVELPAAVRDGGFREDLYYRLSVLPIHLPPLRDRGDDVLTLASHFAERFTEAYGLPPVKLSADVRKALLAHTWPGNIRELRNAIERAVLLGDGAIRTDDLFHASLATDSAAGGPLPFPASIDEIERAAAAAMVDRFDGNKSAAAEALGISRSRLYRLLEEV